MVLKVAVSDGGTGVDEGIYQVLILPGGLKLVQSGMHPVDIPVGSRARSDPNATLHVVAPGVECELRVLGSGLARQRLAEALALFLAKRGPAPNLVDYHVPLVLKLLPSALATLPIGATILARGELWGSLAAGLLLAGGFFIARRRDLPVAARIAVLGLVNVLAYGIVIALILALPPSHDGQAPVAATGPAAPPPATFAPAPVASSASPAVPWNVPSGAAPLTVPMPSLLRHLVDGRPAPFPGFARMIAGGNGEFLTWLEESGYMRGQIDPKTGQVTVTPLLESQRAEGNLAWGMFGRHPLPDLDSQGRLALFYRTDKALSVTEKTTGVIRVWPKEAGGKPLPLAIVCKCQGSWFGWGADGRLLVLMDERLTAWDPATGQRVFEFPGAYYGAVALAPSRQWLIAWTAGRYLEVLDTTTGQSLGQVECLDKFNSLTVSPDGQRLAGIDSTGSVRVWDLTVGKLLAIIPNAAGYESYLMWLGPNQLAVVGSSSVYLLDPATESVAAELAPKVIYPWTATEHDGRIWWSAAGIYYPASVPMPEPHPDDLLRGATVAVEVNTGDKARDQKVATVLTSVLQRYGFQVGNGRWKLRLTASLRDWNVVKTGDGKSYSIPHVESRTILVAPDGSIHAELKHGKAFGGTNSRYYAKTTTQSGGRYKDYYDFKRRDPRLAMEEEVWEQFPPVLADMKLPRVVRYVDGRFTTYHRKGSIELAHDTK